MEFIIAAPVFDYNSGGSIALYKLCHLLNKIGIKSSIYPLVSNTEFLTHQEDLEYYLLEFEKKIPNEINAPNCRYSIEEISNNKNAITIYPEVIHGNPIQAKNIVRWFLHHPGFHTGSVCYGTNEYFIKYNNWIKDIDIINSKMSKLLLQITHFPFEIYNNKNTSKTRKGTAFCLRKGKNRKIAQKILNEINFDPENSIVIDGKSHEEIAEIFKSAARFISFDTDTAYSFFAALCDCESIVIPEDNISIENWRPSPEERYGIAYGIENITFANKTKHLLEDQMRKIEEKSLESTIFFAEEAISFFLPKMIDGAVSK
jgi:hypothetical protein